jgi:hypothetical protein
MLFPDLLFLFLDLSKRVRGLKDFLDEVIVGLSVDLSLPGFLGISYLGIT